MTLVKGFVIVVLAICYFGQPSAIFSLSLVLAQEPGGFRHADKEAQNNEENREELAKNNSLRVAIYDEVEEGEASEGEHRNTDEQEEYEDDPLDEEDEEGSFLYGTITAIDDETLFLEDIAIDITEETRIESRALTTGMFIEAFGEWHEDSFRALTFEVFEPESWSYFEGPIGILTDEDDFSMIRVWRYGEDDDTREEWTDEDSNEIFTVAYFDGETFLYGYDFLPNIDLLAEQWYVLEGFVENDAVIWHSIMPVHY